MIPEIRNLVELRNEGGTSPPDVQRMEPCDDGSRHESYDLRSTEPGHSELLVELRGTTGEALIVLLTPNEVEHARREYPDVALFVLNQIQVELTPGGPVESAAASGACCTSGELTARFARMLRRLESRTRMFWAWRRKESCHMNMSMVHDDAHLSDLVDAVRRRRPPSQKRSRELRRPVLKLLRQLVQKSTSSPGGSDSSHDVLLSCHHQYGQRNAWPSADPAN
jgi:hypothetical protein